MQQRSETKEVKKEAASPFVERKYVPIKQLDQYGEHHKEDVTIGYASIAGDKVPLIQEDVCVSGVDLESFKKLTHDQRIIALRNTYAILQNEAKTLKGGSTACTTISWLEDVPDSKERKLIIYTANLGDSSSFFLKIDAQNKIVGDVKRLNSTLHHPEDSKDKPWHQDYKGVLRLGSENEGINMSHSLGDSQFDEYGVEHTPNIEFKEVSLAENETPVIVTICDGQVELVGQLESQIFRKYLQKLESKNMNYTIKYGDKSILIPHSNFTDEKFIQLMIQASWPEKGLVKKSLRQLCYDLTRWGFQGSTDNISNMIAIPGKLPSFAGIFDGHSGAAVALLAAKKFKPTLVLECNKLLNLESKIQESNGCENVLALFKEVIENEENADWWKSFSFKLADEEIFVCKTAADIKAIYNSLETKAENILKLINDYLEKRLALGQFEFNPLLYNPIKAHPLHFLFLGMQSLVAHPEKCKEFEGKRKLPTMLRLGIEFDKALKAKTSEDMEYVSSLKI